jgi:hypothetical protein
LRLTSFAPACPFPPGAIGPFPCPLPPEIAAFLAGMRVWQLCNASDRLALRLDNQGGRASEGWCFG